jgi:hypothetical protein
MQVIAAPGILVPMEHTPRDYITDALAVAVPDTAYYARRLVEGDLIAVAEPTPTARTVKENS